MPPLSVVVTGGAGYIGSHAVRALLRGGHRITILDDLSSGHRETVPSEAALKVGDVTAPSVLEHVCEAVRADAIMHFAARIQVGESVARPDLYYGTNLGSMLRVAEVASRRRIPVVFSSTAAVYGEPETVPIPVDHPCRPENPYGASKWMGEKVLDDAARAAGFGFAVLRYFNAAGADVEAGLVERHHPETHLVPLALDAAAGRTGPLALFGDDWPTEDGTCVRDYVHVVDLADAHLRALEHLVRGGDSLTLNLGGGEGTTVRKILEVVAQVTGQAVPHRIAPRRPGDVARLVADISRAQTLLGWKPLQSDIETIVRDAWQSRRP